ncbi:Rv2231c family pyridoxal phosphate-dependent protein CobC [Catellatospora sp. NPDC049609]|uniref:Rv2231c family pyridoxal phosphate-dependent protein CobC n=1 Tax=Catellatospora sp. NPDC049609 TaxID=3155505 RepID=UPI003432EFE4
MTAYDLGHHGDVEVASGLVDLAVNVRQATLPGWLAGPIHDSLTRLDAYPDGTAARAAVAARHGREPGEVLLTAGAAQAFTLLAQALRDAAHPVVVHPQFTEPEAALLAAGHRVERVLLPEPYTLDPALVPDDADLVLLGNPTNPTSVAHPAEAVAKLARPGRVLVVDEAFADTIPGEPLSLAARRDLPGLVVVRSLTKTWALAGLRVGYLLAAPELVRRLAAVQPLWPVSTPALAAAAACAAPRAVAAEEEIAHELAVRREHLLAGLRGIPGVHVAGTPASSFVLIRVRDGLGVRERLRGLGYAVRRGDTFPGLGPDWLRVAVRAEPVTDAFLAALAAALHDAPA